jgi:phosphoserine phosphatase
LTSHRRLVVQHPALEQEAIAAFQARLGVPPTSSSTVQGPAARGSAAEGRAARGVAVWEDPAVLSAAEIEALADSLKVDAALVPADARLGDYRLLAFDMDSTLITIECIDEIADYAGCKPQVAAITEATMRGEIANFDESLRRRVALLAGLDQAVLARVFDERLRLSSGALELLAAARANGLTTLLVSGGFTYFTERLRAQLGLDHARANTLEVVDGKLTGRVLGRILDADGKAQAVADVCRSLGCKTSDAIAIGDGANDLKMMALAGVSIAYHAKPIVRAQTTFAVTYCGLDAVLNLLPPDGQQPLHAGRDRPHP